MNKEELIEWATKFLNHYINVPILNERQEGALIKGIVKVLVDFKPPKE